MECHINDYYKTIIEDMIGQIKSSTPGQRRWRCTHDYFGEQDLQLDYSLTTRSTFPNWSKFFYEKTPKKERFNYKFIYDTSAYADGYFNGNTRELLGLLKKLLHGQIYCSERQLCAIDIMLKGMLDYIAEYEYENQCSYFWETENEIIR